MNIKVYSEIGKLKKVLVHKPGKEVERLYPEIFERILFDDILHLEQAQKDHDVFVKLMEDEGIEVFYLEKLVGEIFDADPKLREKFLHDFVEQSGAKHQAVKDAALAFWSKIKDNHELVSTIIAGIMKTEIKPKWDKSITAQVSQHDDYPFYIDPIPNILFQRDPIASVYDGMNIHEMAKETRRREGLFYIYLLKYHPEFKNIKPLLNKAYEGENGHVGTMEGGDVLVMSKDTIFVGVSERTTAPAVEELATTLFKRYKNLKRVIGIEIPKSHATMHLDTVFTMMDRDKFSVDYDMVNQKYFMYEITSAGIKTLTMKIDEVLKKYICKTPKLIVCGGGNPVHAKAEQWNDGANCLTIAPGVIVVYDRNTYTNAAIEKAGVRLLKVPSGELSRGRGGPRCMTMPLEREDV